MIICPVPHRENAAAAGRGTYTIGSSASLRWVGGDCQQHAHPRILLPQNRSLPHLLAAPFPHQPEPRCNTLDFASKVVCQRAFRRSLDSSRQGTGKWGALCSTGRIRHLAQKIDCKFYLTIRGICTIIAIR